MSESHITPAQWELYFSPATEPTEKMDAQTRIVLHTASCAECRAILEKGIALRQAARQYVSFLNETKASKSDPYQAVASMNGTSRGRHISGRLSIDIDIRKDDAFFLVDTLDAEGYARKYAMNPETGNRCMIDDGGELVLSLEDGVLTVLYQDGNLCVHAVLQTETDSILMHFYNNRAQVTLPDEDYCTLDIDFSE